jgi:hypothetical protein
MKPLYAARIEDLGPGDFVKVECIACGHAELLASDQLRIKGQALPAYTPVLDLELRLRSASAIRRGRRWYRLGGRGDPCLGSSS